MHLNKKISLFCIFLMVLVSFTSCVCATDDYVECDFSPIDVIFHYSDCNISTYKGDTGLLGADFTNTDNETYHMSVDQVRGFAKATNKTFKLTEPITIKRDENTGRDKSFKYYIRHMEFKNGTEIRMLSISDSKLTAEEKAYFDDYESEREEYLAQQNQFALEEIEDTQSQILKSSSSKRSGIGIGTYGIGYYHEL